jgi:CrcB protein
MLRFFWVCLGGAAGTGARYFLSSWVSRRFGAGFPLGTLAVNGIGSFAIGVVMHLGLSTDVLSPTLRVALATGVLGGFTTYSSFNYETLRYLTGGAVWIGVINAAAMIVCCLAAGFIGLAFARWVVGN